MRLLDKLLGGARFRPVITGHPEVGPIVRQLRTRLELAPARELFAASRGRWAMRWLLVRAVAEYYVPRLAESRRASLIEGWIREAREEALPYLARAQANVEAAWHARGRGKPGAVDADARRQFEHHMRATVPDLERAATIDPGDPTPHYIWMGAASGIYDAAAARDRMLRHYRDVLTRAPDHYPAHKRALFLLSERWYGSREESLELARRASQGASDGSELPMLVVSAHEAARSYRHFFEHDEAGAAAYTRDPHVVLEVDSAYARSLGSRLHQPTDLTAYRRHEAAVWFWASGDKARTRAELEQIGDLFDPDEDPWHISTERYLAIRKDLGL